MFNKNRQDLEPESYVHNCSRQFVHSNLPFGYIMECYIIEKRAINSSNPESNMAIYVLLHSHWILLGW